MKRFTIPCDFAGVKAPFHIYVGEPAPDLHPLQFQAAWLSDRRGGKIPPEVMESFEKLHTIAKTNGVSFEELCVYALGTATDKKKDEETAPPAEKTEF